MNIQNRVISEVAAYSRTPISVIKSKARDHEIVSLRALAIKCMIKKGLSLQTIGRFFGHSDHTSALHARDTDYPNDYAIPLILERLP